MIPTRVCVICNPAAGRGRARRHIERLRQVLGPRGEFHITQGPGHGEELAVLAAQAGFGVVAAAGGDGTMHEVANGLLRAERPEVALAAFPIGSANDYVHSLRQASCWCQGSTTEPWRAVDVGMVREPGGRGRYFLNGLGLGFNGAVTLESRRIRWLRGVPLYALALLRAACFHYGRPSMTVALDDQVRQVPTLALSVSLGRREGNFVLAPHAQLDDGLFDYLHAGPIAWWELLRHVPGIVTGNLPVGHPALWLGRCRRARVDAEAPLIIHVDGEFFSRPEDGVRSVEVQILPGRLRVWLANSENFAC